MKNTGNTVIKNQFVRFEFPKETEILDTFFEPSPPKEFGVTELHDAELERSEVKIKIAHLEKQQHVGIRFVIDGSAGEQLKILPFNPEGDVDFAAASIARARDEKNTLERFLLVAALYLLIPPVLFLIPSDIGEISLLVFYLPICVILVRMLPGCQESFLKQLWRSCCLREKVHLPFQSTEHKARWGSRVTEA